MKKMLQILVLCVVPVALIGQNETTCDSVPIPFNTTLQKHMYRQGYNIMADDDSLMALVDNMLNTYWGNTRVDGQGENQWLSHRRKDTSRDIIVHRLNIRTGDSALVRTGFYFMAFDSLLVIMVSDFQPFFAPPEHANGTWYDVNAPEFFSWYRFIHWSDDCMLVRSLDNTIRATLQAFERYLTGHQISAGRALNFELME